MSTRVPEESFAAYLQAFKDDMGIPLPDIEIPPVRIAFMAGADAYFDAVASALKTGESIQKPTYSREKFRAQGATSSTLRSGAMRHAYVAGVAAAMIQLLNAITGENDLNQPVPPSFIC